MNSNGKRYLHYPDQKMKPHSKTDGVGGTPDADGSDDELNELTNRDPFVQGLLMKSGQAGRNAEDSRALQYPVFTFPGVDPTPKNSNPFRSNFWVGEYCFHTPSYRVRRSVFKVPGGENIKRHYVYLTKTKGKNMHEMIRIDEADLLPLEQAFAAIRQEIDAYPQNN